MEYVKAKETSTEKPKQINDKPILSDEMETNTEEFQIGSLLNPQDIPPLAEAMPEPIPEVVPVAEAVPEVAEAISPETAEETESLEKKKQLQTERKSRLLAQKEEMKRKIITLNISLSDPNHSFEQREPIYQEIIKVQESLLFINGYYARLILAEQVEANQEN